MLLEFGECVIKCNRYSLEFTTAPTKENGLRLLDMRAVPDAGLMTPSLQAGEMLNSHEM